MKNHITFFDRTTLVYSSLFVTGLYQNIKKLNYTFSIEKHFPDFLNESKLGFPEKNILSTISLFKATIENDEFYFCIDTGDANGQHSGYEQLLLDNVKFYFKVNFNQDLIAEAPFKNKIIPTPIVYPVTVPALWQYFPPLSFRSSQSWPRHEVINRIKQMLNLVNLTDVRQLRQTPKDIDIFFVVTYYDQAWHEADNEFRYQLISAIRKLKGIKAIAGFASRKPLPGKYAEFQIRRYLLNEYLEMQSRAKIAIYVRGLHNCLSFKLGSLLGMGSPIIGQPLLNNTSNYKDLNYYSEQFAFEKPEEIIQAAIELLDHPDRQKALAKSNASFFDENLTSDKIIENIIKVIFS